MITAIILVSLATILAYGVLQKHAPTLLGLFLLALFVIGGGLAIFPHLANLIAARLGVGRGADLLLYFAVLSGVFISTNFYYRFKRTERALTLIVRQLALYHAIDRQDVSL